ncbi:MAG: response regulator [Chromatiaceae bacterium]|nr:response regulator [Chromatiaceae bacterium]MCF7994993.1 response regulator [Chromatiaceae bacterium]MCF8005243.1 response regulator [Chromatiaceae bacterium]MCF8014867.1 response regulator [Chromatiaceae bacterium]
MATIDPGIDPGSEERPHVLIVDDVSENIEVLAAALGSECEVFFAMSGDEAIEIASSLRIDLILLDIMMPDVDGYEVCRLLKLDPRLAEIPVIFVTAKTDIEDEAKGFEVGGVDYITKPIKRLRVRARVSTHLQLKATRDRLRALAQVDSIAGVANRATFDSLLEREIKRAELEQMPLSLLLIGIDDFGALVDTRGHLAIESLLERVGQGLAEQARGALDFCAHFGGPQFAIILPQQGAETALNRAAAVVDAVAQLGLKGCDPGQPVTASVGGITVEFALIEPDQRIGPHDLALAATQALEQAANSGCGQLWLQRWESAV